MKIKILYYEIQEKEFRSEKSLKNFLKKKLSSEILGATEYDKGIRFKLELRSFIEKYRD